MIILIVFSCKEKNDSYDKNIFFIESKAFKNKGKIPKKYTEKSNGGKNISIPVRWQNSPPETKSFCLIIVDKHPVANNFIHWFVVNIPAKVTELKEGVSLLKMPPVSIEYNNSFGYKGYGGPLSPKESGIHNYEVILYSLNVEYVTEFNSDETIFYEYNDIEKILDKYIIQKTKILFFY